MTDFCEKQIRQVARSAIKSGQRQKGLSRAYRKTIFPISRGVLSSREIAHGGLRPETWEIRHRCPRCFLLCSVFFSLSGTENAGFIADYLSQFTLSSLFGKTFEISSWRDRPLCQRKHQHGIPSGTSCSGIVLDISGVVW